MSRLIIFHEIVNLLSDHCSRTTRKNKQHLTDEANFDEDTAATILSEVLQISLSNANTVNLNTKAIDLQDQTNKIQVQVTTAVSGFVAKKNTTIEKFLEESDYDQVQELIIFFFTNEKVGAEILESKAIRENCSYVGYDLDKLLGRIKVLDEQTQSRILQLIKPEFGSYNEITNFQKPAYDQVADYIERRFSVPGESLQLFNWYNEPAQRLSLVEIIKGNKQNKKSTRLLIRADAAMGKSKEIEHAANYYSDLSKGILPVVIYLKNFDGELDAYISGFQKHWQRIKPRQLLLLFDGLDEIASEIMDSFLRKFNLFLQSNPLIHIVATIRSNFDANEIGKAIAADRKLQELRLGHVNDKDISWYVNQRLDQSDVIRFEAYKQRSWVQDLVYSPFYLANIVDLILAGQQILPADRASLIEQFMLIKNKKDHEKYGHQLDVPEIVRFADKLSVFLTLTGKNALRAGELQQLTNLKLVDIRRSSLFKIEKQDFETFLTFAHNNFQEYLAAKHLLSLPWERLEPLLFHTVVPNVIKPKMVNTVNFLFSMLKVEDAVMQNLIRILVQDNQSIVLKFEREKIDRTERFAIFKSIIEKGASEKIYWLGGDIRAGELAYFVGYSERSLNYLVELLTKTGEHYARLCLFDLVNLYANETIADNTRAILLKCVTGIILDMQVVPDQIERAIEALIHFKLGDGILLANLQKNSAADAPLIRLLILKYIAVMNFPGQFDYCLESVSVLVTKTTRSLSSKESVYFEYLVSHLRNDNAIKLLAYFMKHYQYVEQVLDNAAFLHQPEKPIDQLYRKLAGIYKDSGSEPLFSAILTLVKHVTRRMRNEKFWGSQHLFFELTETGEVAFFELFSDPRSIQTRQILCSLFKKDYTPKILALMNDPLDYRALHRWSNFLLDQKHPDGPAFREALDQHAPPSAVLSNDWNNYQVWQESKRQRDMDILSSSSLFLNEVAATYRLLTELQETKPEMTMMQLQFEDGAEIRDRITNNLIFETMVPLDDPENFEEFRERFFLYYKWENFVFQIIFSFIQDEQYTVSTELKTAAFEYLRSVLLPPFSLKKTILSPLGHDEFDQVIVESALYFFMRQDQMLPIDFLFDLIAACQLSVVDNQYEQQGSDNLTLTQRIVRIVGRTAFEEQVLANLKDPELTEYVRGGQATLAGLYGFTKAIPLLKNQLLSSIYSVEMKDGIVDALKQLSADPEVFVSLFDSFGKLEYRWQFNVCEYLYQFPAYRKDVVTVFENSVAGLDGPSNFWYYQMVGMGIQSGSKSLAAVFLESLRNRKAIPEYSSVRVTDFEELGITEGRWLVETCLDLLPGSIGHPENARYEQVSEFLEEVLRLEAIRDTQLFALVNQRYDELVSANAVTNPDFNYIQWYKIRLKKGFVAHYQELENPESAINIIGQLFD